MAQKRPCRMQTAWVEAQAGCAGDQSHSGRRQVMRPDCHLVYPEQTEVLQQAIHLHHLPLLHPHLMLLQKKVQPAPRTLMLLPLTLLLPGCQTQSAQAAAGHCLHLTLLLRQHQRHQHRQASGVHCLRLMLWWMLPAAAAFAAVVAPRGGVGHPAGLAAVPPSPPSLLAPRSLCLPAAAQASQHLRWMRA